MNYYLFYFFSVLAIGNAFYMAFTSGKTKSHSSLILFLFSVSGILVLINAGYLAFIILVSTAVIFSVKILIKPLVSEEEKSNHSISLPQLISVSMICALTASVTTSTIWQNNVVFKKEITQANLGESLALEYYPIILSLLVSFFILRILIRTEKPV